MANVILLGTATVGVTAISQLAQNKDATRTFLGGVLYVGMLTLIELGSPAFASGLAVVVLVTALILNGVPFLTAVTRKVK